LDVTRRYASAADTPPARNLPLRLWALRAARELTAELRANLGPQDRDLSDRIDDDAMTEAPPPPSLVSSELSLRAGLQGPPPSPVAPLS
jgi:hypothetical protein